MRLLLPLPFLVAGVQVSAQISLQTAVDLALRNSPRVRGAQADLAKAQAARGEAKDAFIPVVTTTGGYGQYTGAPLDVPVVFNIAARSLVFSFSQHDYIRSAQASVEATEHALREQQVEVVEDTTNTYLALDSAIARHDVLVEEHDIAGRLITVTSDRVDAGIDARVELPKARRVATQVSLTDLQIDDEIAANTQHLATLTGLPSAGLRTEPASIPRFATPVLPPVATDTIADSEGIAAAFSTARAKQFAAFGDTRYLFRPQIYFGASYSRVDTGLSSYAAYYPSYQGTPTRPNSQNALGFGLQITVPLLDYSHRSKARGSAADAARALADAEQQRGIFREGRAKLQHSTLELQLRQDLARDEQEIAAAQLESVQLQLQAGGGNAQAGPQLTPKDQLSAQLQERERYYDLLTAQLQLRQTQVNLLRQTDHLDVWIGNPGPTASATPVLTPGAIAPVAPGAAPVSPQQSPASTPQP